MSSNMFVKVSHRIPHVYIPPSSISSPSILSGDFNDPNNTIYLESLFTLPMIVFSVGNIIFSSSLSPSSLHHHHRNTGTTSIRHIYDTTNVLLFTPVYVNISYY